MLNLQAQKYHIAPDGDVGSAVRNTVGRTASVVHQYDRDEPLQKRLFARHVYWIDTTDPMSEWRSTEQCTGFMLTENSDLFKGNSFSLTDP